MNRRGREGRRGKQQRFLQYPRKSAAFIRQIRDQIVSTVCVVLGCTAHQQ
jgi:hypothetical protein